MNESILSLSFALGKIFKIPKLTTAFDGCFTLVFRTLGSHFLLEQTLYELLHGDFVLANSAFRQKKAPKKSPKNKSFA